MQVHGPPPDPVTARVTDDHSTEASQQRAQQHERGPHLRRRFERHELPLDVACGDLVDVVLRVIDHDAQFDQRLGHHAHVLDLGDVRDPAPLTSQRRSGEHLECRVLRAADGDGTEQRTSALHAEDFPRDRLGDVLPVERSGVGHEG
jgi:hypothetical protein